MNDLMNDIKKHYEEKIENKDLPEFSVGDTVKVFIKVTEGSKSRLQAFEGLVIRKKGKDISSTFTVRRMSQDVGVERTFPFHSPLLEKMEIKKKGKVRKSRLYYMRERKGKSARIKERR